MAPGYVTATSSGATDVYVWAVWNQHQTVTTSCCYTSDATVVWKVWAGNSTTVTVTSSSAVWTEWNGSISNLGVASIVYRPSPEAEARAAKARILRDEADKRAESLLMQFLSEQQEQQYRRERFFEVLSKDGNRRYKLHKGWAGNVTVIDDATGRAVETLCIHPNCQVPHEDNLLAQKLLLEADEETFRRTANITKLRLVA